MGMNQFRSKFMTTSLSSRRLIRDAEFGSVMESTISCNFFSVPDVLCCDNSESEQKPVLTDEQTFPMMTGVPASDLEYSLQPLMSSSNSVEIPFPSRCDLSEIDQATPQSSSAPQSSASSSIAPNNTVLSDAHLQASILQEHLDNSADISTVPTLDQTTPVDPAGNLFCLLQAAQIRKKQLQFPSTSKRFSDLHLPLPDSFLLSTDTPISCNSEKLTTKTEISESKPSSTTAALNLEFPSQSTTETETPIKSESTLECSKSKLEEEIADVDVGWELRNLLKSCLSIQLRNPSHGDVNRVAQKAGITYREVIDWMDKAKGRLNPNVIEEMILFLLQSPDPHTQSLTQLQSRSQPHGSQHTEPFPHQTLSSSSSSLHDFHPPKSPAFSSDHSPSPHLKPDHNMPLLDISNPRIKSEQSSRFYESRLRNHPRLNFRISPSAMPRSSRHRRHLDALYPAVGGRGSRPPPPVLRKRKTYDTSPDSYLRSAGVRKLEGGSVTPQRSRTRRKISPATGREILPYRGYRGGAFRFGDRAQSYMRQLFGHNETPNRSSCERIAEEIFVSYTPPDIDDPPSWQQVRTWFKNRRFAEKQKQKYK